MPANRLLNILVVDDEKEIREWMVDALLLDGHRVAGASNGEAALALCAAEDFDVVFTDFDLSKSGGKMNGIEFAGAVLGFGKCPRIILTSGDLGQVGLAGFAAAATKPIPLTLLRALAGNGSAR